MAKKSTSKEVAIKERDGGMIPFDSAPDYLTGKERSGMENMGKDDFKIPQIKLLQPLSPEIRSFQGKAIPGEFWHTGLNISLGSEFTFVPVIVGKRVIVWRPRDDNDGGILAMSKDGRTWLSGGNKKFTVKIKGKKEPVIWDTKKDVATSGLLEFGTSNPDEDNSPPAATVSYEYLAYIPERPEMGVAVLRASRTATPYAKKLNTSLMLLNKPTYCVMIKCFSDEESGGNNVWFVPQFDPAGFANKAVYGVTKPMSDQYAEYDVEYTEDDVEVPSKDGDASY